MAPGVEHAQLGRLVRLHDDGGVTQREWKCAAVEQEDVGLALRRVVVAMHALLDLAWVLVGRGDPVQSIVDVHVDQRIFGLVGLARALSQGLDAARAGNETGEVIVRPPRLDDDHAGEPHRHMHMLVDVAMIEIGAGKSRGEFVGEALARHDLRPRHVGNAVHVVGLRQPVQMDGVREIVGVVERDLDPLALLHAQRRRRYARGRAGGAADRRIDPERHELAGIDFLLHLDDLETEMHPGRIAVGLARSELDRVVGGVRECAPARLRAQPRSASPPRR